MPETLLDIDTVAELESEELMVLLSHAVNVGETLAVIDASPVSEDDGQPETDALGDDDAVLEEELVDEPEDVLDAVEVGDDVPVNETDGDVDGERLDSVVNVLVVVTDADGHTVAAALCVSDTEPVADDDASPEFVTLGEDDAVLELELVDEPEDVLDPVAVDDTELVDDDVLDPVLDELDDAVAVDDGKTLGVGDTDPESDDDGQPETVALEKGDAELDTEPVKELHLDVVGLALALDEPVDDAVLVPELDELDDADAVADDELVLDRLVTVVAVISADEEYETVTDPDAEPVVESDALGDKDEKDVALGNCDGEACALSETDGLPESLERND